MHLGRTQIAILFIKTHVVRHALTSALFETWICYRSPSKPCVSGGFWDCWYFDSRIHLKKYLISPRVMNNVDTSINISSPRCSDIFRGGLGFLYSPVLFSYTQMRRISLTMIWPGLGDSVSIATRHSDHVNVYTFAVYVKAHRISSHAPVSFSLPLRYL